MNALPLALNGRVPFHLHAIAQFPSAHAINVAISLVEQHEERLRAILKSKDAMPEDKFQALVDLANLAGILLNEVAEAEDTPD